MAGKAGFSGLENPVELRLSTALLSVLVPALLDEIPEDLAELGRQRLHQKDQVDAVGLFRRWMH